MCSRTNLASTVKGDSSDKIDFTDRQRERLIEKHDIFIIISPPSRFWFPEQVAKTDKNISEDINDKKKRNIEN